MVNDSFSKTISENEYLAIFAGNSQKFLCVIKVFYIVRCSLNLFEMIEWLMLQGSQVKC